MSEKKKKHLQLLILLSVAMLALSYASVPLYRIICQKTGFGGTPHLADHLSQKVVDRTLTIQFVGNVHRDLPWIFKPKQHQIRVKVGQNFLIHYYAKNNGTSPFVGMATYNVTPDKAAIYFTKVQCFCFEQQLLAPGEEMDMPVLFYISPEFAEDPSLKGITTITLSYTFFIFKGKVDPRLQSGVMNRHTLSTF